MKNLLDKINNRLNAQEGFLKAVSLLAGGTAFAHIITVLTLPLLTRLYSPDDFSKLAVYSGLLSIFSVIACLRYEIAIPLPKEEGVAERLLLISIFSSIFFSLFLAIVLFILHSYIKEILGNGYFSQIIWILPLGVLTSSLYSAFKFWSTRTKDFKVIAKTKVQQSSTSVIVQLSLGWFGYTTIGLLIGQLFYSSAGVFSLVRKKSHFQKISYTQLKKTCREYLQYPKYSVGEALFNTAGVHLPILIIASVAAPKEAGYILLASKIMIIPMVLIGASISQVYYAHANDAKYEGRLAQFTYECMNKLALIGVAPLIFIGILAPVVFPIAFGSDWERSGVLVAWMTPWFVMQFIVSPVSMALHVSDNQRLAVVLQFFGLILKILIVWLIFSTHERYISEAYAISGFLFYVIYLIILVNALKIKEVHRIFLNKRMFFMLAISISTALTIFGVVFILT
ncbi:MAG: oligosaccharide flippase family protein [Psychrobacter alimentarius]